MGFPSSRVFNGTTYRDMDGVYVGGDFIVINCSEHHTIKVSCQEKHNMVFFFPSSFSLNKANTVSMRATLIYGNFGLDLPASTVLVNGPQTFRT